MGRFWPFQGIPGHTRVLPGWLTCLYFHEIVQDSRSNITGCSSKNRHEIEKSRNLREPGMGAGLSNRPGCPFIHRTPNLDSEVFHKYPQMRNLFYRLWGMIFQPIYVGCIWKGGLLRQVGSFSFFGKMKKSVFLLTIFLFLWQTENKKIPSFDT